MLETLKKMGYEIKQEEKSTACVYEKAKLSILKHTLEVSIDGEVMFKAKFNKKVFEGLVERIGMAIKLNYNEYLGNKERCRYYIGSIPGRVMKLTGAFTNNLAIHEYYTVRDNGFSMIPLRLNMRKVEGDVSETVNGTCLTIYKREEFVKGVSSPRKLIDIYDNGKIVVRKVIKEHPDYFEYGSCMILQFKDKNWWDDTKGIETKNRSDIIKFLRVLLKLTKESDFINTAAMEAEIKKLVEVFEDLVEVYIDNSKTIEELNKGLVVTDKLIPVHMVDYFTNPLTN